MMAPIPSIVSVKTASGEALTFRVSSLDACEAMPLGDGPRCVVYIGGARFEVCASHDAVVGLMTGQLQPTASDSASPARQP